MIYTVPTPRGMGVELWGTFNDLNNLYDVIGHFWGNENLKNLKGYDNRDELISGFSYEIRHAYQGDRLNRESDHFSTERNRYYGAKFSWVHLLFSLTALKYNMRLVTSSKFDLATFLTLEFWIEKSMKQFDPEGAQKLLPFIEGAIYPANEYLYQYMRYINADYFLLGSGRKSFRQLPTLLKQSIYGTKEYEHYFQFLTKEAARLGCDIHKLELNDDHVNYDIAW